MSVKSIEENDKQPYIWTPIWECEKMTYIRGTNVCDVEIGHGFEDW
jgi:hypothetical protein